MIQTRIWETEEIEHSQIRHRLWDDWPDQCNRMVDVVPIDSRRLPDPSQAWSGDVDCPAGTLRLLGLEDAIVGARFLSDAKPESPTEKQTTNPWGLESRRDNDRALQWYLRVGKGDGQTVVCAVSGTEFQRQVWQRICRIPAGRVATYQAIARSMGKPTASRAVGTAVARNPVAWFIPCHRVVRADGVIGKYRWGRQRKQKLLAAEFR